MILCEKRCQHKEFLAAKLEAEDVSLGNLINNVSLPKIKTSTSVYLKDDVTGRQHQSFSAKLFRSITGRNKVSLRNFLDRSPAGDSSKKFLCETFGNFMLRTTTTYYYYVLLLSTTTTTTTTSTKFLCETFQKSHRPVSLRKSFSAKLLLKLC